MCNVLLALGIERVVVPLLREAPRPVNMGRESTAMLEACDGRVSYAQWSPTRGYSCQAKGGNSVVTSSEGKGMSTTPDRSCSTTWSSDRVDPDTTMNPTSSPGAGT